jgi:NTP pyrophosphatase (non-canonical NTP hydrolase)
MIEIESIIAQIIKHKEDRDIVRDQYPSQIAAKLLEEASELMQAILEAEIGGGATEVAGELGDVTILLIQLADQMGIDPFQAAEIKMMRNDWKAPTTALNNGYPDPYETTSQAYELTGGDMMFYQIYLQLLAEED